MKILNVKFVTAAIAVVGLSMSSYGQVGFNGTNNSGANATALGSQTTASGSAATSLGWRSTASGTQSLAAGHWSTASGLYSFAFGARAVASNSHAMAFGVDARATANRSMVIGTGTANSTAGSLINGTANSLMIGFMSTVPTLFVGPSSGAGTTGKVGVGTTNTPSTIGTANISNYSLYVAGGMLAEEVRVRTGWADYVFHDDYELKPIYEVSDYIKENGHLPNVPSAKQVEEEGIELGDITKIQQEKIEELTLYIIELQKQMDKLELKVEEMEN